MTLHVSLIDRVKATHCTEGWQGLTAFLITEFCRHRRDANLFFDAVVFLRFSLLFVVFLHFAHLFYAAAGGGVDC